MPQSASPTSYASVMVAMDRGASAAARARLAADLADRFSSRLIGIAAEPIAEPLYFEVPVSGVAGIIELEQRRAAEDIAAVEATFRGIAGPHRTVDWRHALTFPSDFAAEQARAADLVVVGRAAGAEPPNLMSVNPGDFVMAAGRPMLLVPPGVDHLSAQNIVVCWADRREARRAITDSLPFLKRATEVSVVSIAADEPGAKDVGEYLRGHGVAASSYARPIPASASVADELIHVAQQQGADLIVCGAYGHSRAREWAFGGVTRDLLHHSPLCCLMSH